MKNRMFLLMALWPFIFWMETIANPNPNPDRQDKASAEIQEEVLNKEMDIYVLIGQSNMAGRAEMGNEDLDSLGHVFLFNGVEWEKAVNPLNKYSTVRKDLGMQKLGPGYTFGKTIAEKTGRQIGLVVNARGGTSIAQWQKGYEGKDDFDLYEETLKQVAKVEGKGQIRGIIWHQGESDQANPSAYMDLLKEFVANLRKDIGKPVPFFAGEIGKWRANAEGVNKVIRKIRKDIKKTAYVSSDDLVPLNGDLTDPHFDAQSQRVLGERYAEKVLERIYLSNGEGLFGKRSMNK